MSAPDPVLVASLTAYLLQRLQSVLGVHYNVERELGGGGMSRVFDQLRAQRK